MFSAEVDVLVTLSLKHNLLQKCTLCTYLKFLHSKLIVCIHSHPCIKLSQAHIFVTRFSINWYNVNSYKFISYNYISFNYISCNYTSPIFFLLIPSLAGSINTAGPALHLQFHNPAELLITKYDLKQPKKDINQM